MDDLNRQLNLSGEISSSLVKADNQHESVVADEQRSSSSRALQDLCFLNSLAYMSNLCPSYRFASVMLLRQEHFEESVLSNRGQPLSVGTPCERENGIGVRTKIAHTTLLGNVPHSYGTISEAYGQDVRSGGVVA